MKTIMNCLIIAILSCMISCDSEEIIPQPQLTCEQMKNEMQTLSESINDYDTRNGLWQLSRMTYRFNQLEFEYTKRNCK